MRLDLDGRPLRFSDLDGARVGVWGAGRETRSFARHLRRRLPSARIAVLARDCAPLAPGGTPGPPGGAGSDGADGGGEHLEGLLVPGVRLVEGGEILEALASCEVVVRSPGVSVYKPELRRLRARGVPVTTATALWFAETGGARTVGVTGTKGKSTTSTLLAHLARATGRTVQLAGNVGAPALDLLDLEPTDLAVIELSSYHLADLEVGPEVAVLTNLHREHLDWHRSEEAYRADKLRILGLPGVRDVVLNARDPLLVAAPRPSGVRTLLFGEPRGGTRATRACSTTARLSCPPRTCRCAGSTTRSTSRRRSRHWRPPESHRGRCPPRCKG